MTGFIFSVSAMEQWTWESSDTDTSALSEINKIQDPYERCVAYVELKKLEGIDCKMKTETMRPKAEPKMQKNISETNLVVWSGAIQPKPPRPPMGTGAMTGTGMKIEKNRECIAPGSCGQGLPPVGTGAKMIESDIKYLTMVVGKLKPEQRLELMKMIRKYLESKGIKDTLPEIKKNENARKGWDGSVKWKKITDEIKIKQGEMIKKEYQMDEMQNREKIKALTGSTSEGKKEFVGHVSLLK